MDVRAFLDQLDRQFEGPVEDGKPRDPRFSAIVDAVPGFTTPAELAVLNLAARLLPDGEGYLEVGTFKGRSLSGVLLDAPDRRYVAVENFSEFGMHTALSRAQLEQSIAQYSTNRAFRLLDGDAFRVLATTEPSLGRIGVYFYDGAHTGLAHYLALGVAEPKLADEAVVLVDDASWPMVARATGRYVRRHSGWSIARDIQAEVDHDQRWANGLLILRYQRPAGATRRMPRDVVWRRWWQVYVRGPLTVLIWRMLGWFPWLVPLAKRLVRKGPRQVPER
jgi:predicted O-methyltransferase YrrM